jgi:NAD/NADP transhydrogenase beta subunit
MENVKSNTGQNLGVAALIIAIVTFVLAVIPCLGLIAIIPGIIAIVLGAVGLSQASRNQLATAGLIIAIIACLISVSQVFVAGALVREAGIEKFPSGIRNVIKEVKSEVLKELEKENFSIRIEKDGKRVIIDGNSVDVNINEERKRILEELEGVSSQNDSLQQR